MILNIQIDCNTSTKLVSYYTYTNSTENEFLNFGDYNNITIIYKAKLSPTCYYTNRIIKPRMGIGIIIIVLVRELNESSKHK